MPVEPDFYPGTNTFINLLGIENAKDLAEAEADLTAVRTEEYRQNPPEATFDLEHMRAIHRHLFQDLFEWAGEIRSYNFGKWDSLFAPYDQIEDLAASLYGELAEENYLVGLNKEQFICRIAYYYDVTNRIHPFPEGNGRTQRLFIEHLTTYVGYSLDWVQVPQWEIGEIAIQSMSHRNIEPTEYMFERIVI